MPSDPNARVSFPRLDGLRALCFISVFFSHGFYTEDQALLVHPVRHFVKGFLFASGDLGVNVFFVLSGFLITFLLLREREVTGSVHVGHFWMRRVLRIWPLYFACVAFGFLGFPLIKSALGQVPNEHAEPLYYLFFAGNFDVLFHGLPDSSCLAVLWSIAVEEQFYLVWPILLFLLPHRAYPWTFGAIFISSLAFNLAVHDSRTTFFHTFSCMGDLAMGACGAWLLARPSTARWIGRWPGWCVMVINFSFLGLYLARSPLAGAGASEGLLRAAIAFNAMLVVISQAGSKTRWGMIPDWRALNYLGRISYGLYCLHPIGILAAIQCLRMAGMDHHVWQIILLQPVLAFGITVAIAATSHRFYESPFLGLKTRFAKITR